MFVKEVHWYTETVQLHVILYVASEILTVQL